jgi:hypothetical protein
VTKVKPGPGEGAHINSRQVLYVRYLAFVLVDLVAINLFVEYWDKVVIDSFTITLFTACVMQLLLKLTIALEHRLAQYFKAKPGKGRQAMRWLTTWFIMFSSKFVILGVIGLIFGDHVDFGGVIPFFAVVFSILIAEALAAKPLYALGD